MSLANVLTYVEFGSAILLIIVVLLQSRSSGMGTIFGGGGGGTFRARRGMEAILFNSTIVLGIIFTISAIAIAILNVRSI
jgi:protein translocase SecG subunit